MEIKKLLNFFDTDLWDWTKAILWLAVPVLALVGLYLFGDKILSPRTSCNGNCCPEHRVSGKQIKQIEERLKRIEELLMDKKVPQNGKLAEIQYPPEGW